ncbi:stage II sporulation protein P [Bacillus salipaludis]|uniref:Stage II sporulation protein P n=1 Tax=Bacillus salipaludis TaxID=2547811 RepID=A0A4R5VZY5_9BACI|nr:stage II sporulation protein P [Bacillus salipaludis]MDQ6596708.1 stage II sporulation protein P [Bacillus salipaludis]TDK65069.1 stage II sporulation protein P [Bacillus salipaludis]
MKKNKPFSLFIRINGAVLSVIFIFILIAGMTTILSLKMSSDSVGEVLETSDLNKLYLYFFGSENKYYIQNSKDIKDIPLTKVGFQIATNIKISDIRTFFERELPGFAEFNTKIELAGQGTDLTTLPIESAPPMDVLLKERDIAQNELNENDSNENNNTPPPSQTTNGKQVVFIYHTHSWESYLPLLKGVTNPDEAVSSNNRVNVVGVGDYLVKDLAARGIGSDNSTINATQELHKRGLDYYSAYQFSRGVVQEAMAGNHDLKFMIDIHRDSLGRQKTTTTINGKSYARLVFIVGQNNSNYEKNTILAKNLHKALEKKYPGLSRGVVSKDKSEGNGVYNQDLSPRAILLEVGGVDNNMTELHNAIDAFADVFSEYYWHMKNAKAF